MNTCQETGGEVLLHRGAGEQPTAKATFGRNSNISSIPMTAHEEAVPSRTKVHWAQAQCIWGTARSEITQLNEVTREEWEMRSERWPGCLDTGRSWRLLPGLGLRTFPGNAVVKTPCFHCWGSGLKCEGSGSPQRHGKVWANTLSENSAAGQGWGRKDEFHSWRWWRRESGWNFRIVSRG